MDSETDYVEVLEEVYECVRKGVPLNAISIISEKAPEDVRSIATNIFADPMCTKSVDELWRNVLLLIYFSHYSYMSGSVGSEENISDSAVSSLTAAKLCRRLGIPDLEARFLILGGRAIYKMKMKDKAEKIFKEAERILKELLKEDSSTELKAELANAMNELAVLYMDIDRKEEAEKYLLKALEIRKEIKDREAIAESLYNAGTYYMRSKKLDIAESYYKECEKILWELCEENKEHIPKLGMLLNNMGVLYRKMSKYDKSEEYHQEALGIFDGLAKEDEGWNKYVADTFGYIGTMYNDMMKFDEASKYYDMAKKIYNELEKKEAQKIKSNKDDDADNVKNN